MKLNFWQWIGLIIFAIALILIIRREASGPDRREAPSAPGSVENVEPAPPADVTAPPATAPAS